MKTLISVKLQMFSKLQLDNCRLYVSKPNILTEIEINIGKGIASMAGALNCLLGCPVELFWTLSKFSVTFGIIPSKIFPRRRWRLFYLSHTHDHTMQTMRWQCQKRHKKEGKKIGYLKTAPFSFQYVVLLHGAISWMWTQSSYQPIDPCDLPAKAAVQHFMITLLPYERAFSILSKSFSAKDTNTDPRLVIFMGSPVCSTVFMCCYKWGQVFQMTTSHFRWLPQDSID